MTGQLAGRVAFVTGAATGLGRRIARTFAAAGAGGAGFDIAADYSVPDGWQAMQGDVTREGALRAAMTTLRDAAGRLDIVVANAGIVPPWRRTEDIDLDEWDRVFAVNVRGVVATLKHAAPLLSDGGSIVVMASLNSRRAHPRQCAYTASKHAVLGIVRSVAQDLGGRGIRVNALGPGPVATDALLERVRARAASGGPEPQQALRELAAASSLGRLATEDDVASVALFLAGDQSAGITGQILPVDAGLT